MKNVFFEYEEYFSEGLRDLTLDRATMTGYRVNLANGIDELCFVDLESDWYFNEKIVPIKSFNILLYNYNGVGIEIDGIDDAPYSLIRIYLNVSEQEESNILNNEIVTVSQP